MLRGALWTPHTLCISGFRILRVEPLAELLEGILLLELGPMLCLALRPLLRLRLLLREHELRGVAECGADALEARDIADAVVDAPERCPRRCPRRSPAWSATTMAPPEAPARLPSNTHLSAKSRPELMPEA